MSPGSAAPGLRARLEARGFDGELENLQCLVRVEDLAPLRHSAAARELARRRADSPAPLLAALEGKLLNHLGRPAEALALLAGAQGLREVPAPAWLGESRLLLGDFAGARAALDRAAAEMPDYPWTFFLRSAARLGLGELDAAGADCDRFLRARPGPAAHALKAVLLGRQARWSEAGAEVAQARLLSPGRAWPWVLASALSRAAGDPAAARAALAEALRVKPSAWLWGELAAVYEQLGMLPEALSAAAKAVRLDPTAERRAAKARLHLSWREYGRAAAELTAGLSRAPQDAGLLFLRSKAYSGWARPAEAAADAAAAAAAAPGDEDLMCWSLQAGLVGGRARESLRDIERLLRGPGAKAGLKARGHFLRAYHELLEARPRAARGHLARCRAAAGSGALGLKALFYETLCGVLEAGAPRPATGGLHLLGFGVNPPYSATAEALRAAAACDVLFNNVMGEEMYELLRPLCRDVRPLAYHQDGDEGRLARLILSAAGPGRTVGFVTRGNALIYGGLGPELVRRCRERGVAWRGAAGVSSPESLLARFGRRDAPGGQAAVDGEGLARGAFTDAAVPTTVFIDLGAGAGVYRRLCAALSAHFGSDEPCLVLDHVIGQEPARRRMSELEPLWESLSPSALFHVPAGGSR